MSERMAAKGVAAKQNDVNSQHNRAETDTKGSSTGRIDKPKCLPNVDGKNHYKNQREIKKIAMNVLHDKREGTFAQISLAWLAHRTGRRVGPEGCVVGAPVIIAGYQKPVWRPLNQERGREEKPARPPARFGPRP